MSPFDDIDAGGSSGSIELSPELEARVEEIAEAYLADLHAGRASSREALLAEHAEIAEPLRRRLVLIEMVHGVASRSSGDGTARELRCPHCGHRARWHEPQPREIVCGSCGSTFRVEAGLPGDAPDAPVPASIGRFQVLSLLGRGSFGSVYEAHDPELNRTVAVKVPRAGYFAGAQDEERFLREARSAARLRHPSIVTVHEIGYQEGVPYLVSDLIPGRTLSDVIASDRPGFRESAELTAQIAEALAYAHGEKVVHRDVKPQNILMDGRKPHIADFGLARADEGEVTVTLEGQILGTPAYMSPEQAAGAHAAVDARSDVYSLGVVLYELLTGQRPFNGSKNMVIYQVLHEEPRPPRKLNDHIPRDLETICLKAMAKEPVRRYLTAASLAGDLRRYLRGETIDARPAGALERIWRWSRRNRLVATLAGAVALLLMTVAVVATAMAIHTARARDAATERLSRLNVATAFRLVAEGDLLGSLPWLAEAWRLDSGRPDREMTHRMRFEAILGQCPRLAEVWFLAPPASLVFSRGGERLALLGGGTVQVVDLQKDDHGTVPLEGAQKVQRATFSADARRLATAGSDGVARIWDAASGKPISGPLVHEPAVIYAQFSPDGRLLATAGADKTARIWDTTTGAPAAAPLQHAGQVNQVFFSPDGHRLVTACSDGTAQVWETLTGRRVFPALQHRGSVFHATYSADGRRVLTAGAEGTIGIWNAATGVAVCEPIRHTRILRVSMSPDGSRVITASHDGSARLWSADTGLLIHPPFRHRLGVPSAAFGAVGRQVMTAGNDGEVRVWDTVTGKPALPLIYHGSRLSDASLSADGHWLATVGAEGGIRLWDLAGSEPVLPLAPPESGASRAALSPRGDLIAVVKGANDSRVEVWGVLTCDLVHRKIQHAAAIESLEFSPDGRYLVTAGTLEKVRVWNVADGAPSGAVIAHGARVSHACFRPDGEAILTCGYDGRALLWSFPDGEKIGSSFVHGARIIQAAFSPDGSKLATASDDRTAQLWDVQKGSPLGEPLRHANRVRSVSFNADGRWVLTASLDSTARIWDAATAAPRTDYLRHQTDLFHAEFSPDGRLAVTTSRDGAARVWDAGTGEPVAPEFRHNASVMWASFSSDGRRVVTAGWDSTAVVWDVSSGEQITPPLEHANLVLFASFTPDDRRLVTVDEAGDVRLWTLPDRVRPLEEARLIAQLTSGSRLDASGGIERLSANELRAAWEELRRTRPPTLETSAERLLGWHAREAAKCERTEWWSAALPHLDYLLSAYPAPAQALRWRRARALAALGKFEEAAAEYARTVEMDRSREEVWYEHALVRVANGDLDGAREVCDACAATFEHSSDPEQVRMAAWTYALVTPANKETSRAVPLARKALALYSGGPDLRNTLGAVLYRTGELNEALAQLEEAGRMRGGAESTWDWVFLAMVHQALGHHEEARRWLERTRRWWEQIESGKREISYPGRPHWRMRLEMKVLLKEAEQAIAGG